MLRYVTSLQPSSVPTGCAAVPPAPAAAAGPPAPAAAADDDAAGVPAAGCSGPGPGSVRSHGELCHGAEPATKAAKP